MVVLEELYRVKQKIFSEKLGEQTDPHIIYVTDLVACSHKRVLRRLYPFLAFKFEPQLILGDLVHSGLSKAVSSAQQNNPCMKWVPEVEVERDFKIEGETYKLKGRADLVLYNCDKPVMIAEVKTSRAMPSNKPLEHHMLQLQVYMELLNVDQGVLVYITPDRLVEYPVSRLRINLESLVRETITNTVKPRYDWECSYCPFNKLCPYAKEHGKG